MIMLPVKMKITNLGQIKREYIQILSFYEDRIKKLARIKFSNEEKITGYSILLDRKGKMMNSEEFYKLIQKQSVDGKTLHFVIGPPTGFGKVSNGKYMISLSNMTFRHELAYLVLLEQIYRSLLKMKGTNYEK